MISDISFESLDYGAYQLIYDTGRFDEATNYELNEFNKLYVKQVKLPAGKGNIVYLLSDSFDHIIRMIQSKNFILPTNYHRLYCPWISVGKFMGKRYKMNITKLRNERSKLVKEQTKLQLYGARSLSKSIENIIISTSDLYTAVEPILQKSTIRRNYTEFFPEFISILNQLTPPIVKPSKEKSWNHRILLIDADAFAFQSNASLDENKTNPLFLFYLSYLKNRDLSSANMNMDMLICSKNMFLKFNPSTLTSDKWNEFRKALFRIMNTNLDNYTASLNDEEKESLKITSKEHIVSNIINDTIAPYAKIASPSTQATLANAIEKSLKDKVKERSEFDSLVKDHQKEIADKTHTKNPSDDKNLFTQSLLDQNHPSFIHQNSTQHPLNKKEEDLFRYLGKSYEPLAVSNGTYIDEDEYDPDDEYPEENLEDYEEPIKNDVNDILTQDEEIVKEVLDDIQEKTIPLKNPKTAPVNSARDKKLREEQKKLVVKESTIEEVLSRDSKNIPIITEDKSKVMHTTNENMKKITFAYFDKSYIEESYTKDILSCFDMLKDKEYPFYITGIDIKDTSTTMDLKETWTVHLTDENKKRSTIKVDIPKFHEDRFMFINGTKWIILKQNFYNPLVKDTPDTVILTTNYNKVTIHRKATKSMGTVERIFSLIKKTGDDKVFTIGDSSKGNLKYISSLEYDELARRLFKFSSNDCNIYFSRDYIKDNLEDKVPADRKGNEFYIGNEGNIPILINEDTGLDRSGRTIIDIIEDHLSEEYRAIFRSIKAPSQPMFAEGKLAGEYIPIIVTLVLWIGLKNTLDKMKIRWNFHSDMKRIPAPTSSSKYIRFADGILEYESKTFAELILNGIIKLHPEKFQFEQFETEECYDEYIFSQWGNYNGILELRNFYEFMVDPITKDYCEDLFLPTDPAELLIHAVKLLADNSYVSKASDKSYRTRSIEMVSALLYSKISLQYKAYVKSGRKLPMTLNQRCILNAIIAEKTVEAYSTLNPIIEVSKTHSISTKGYRGSNSEHSYDEEKRSYDPSAVGKLSITTSAKSVGRVKLLELRETP